MDKIGRYQILGLLGEGAMAKVYKAVDERIDRVVALKMLQFREGMTDEMIQQLKDRFVHEAKLAGKLTHPNIVTIFDAEEEDGVSYMAMEYVDGRTLESLIDGEGEMTVEQQINLMIQVCQGLDYAHKHDIIHRDIKPGNIILTTDEVPKIMDFGIAKISTSNTTVMGTILGTPGYMSPEQITGKSVDHRTDLFAAGAVFYEMLTKQKAFPGTSLTEIMYRVVSENPVPPFVSNSSIPEPLSDAVIRAMHKNPAERYQSGAEFAKRLIAIKEQLTHPDKTDNFKARGIRKDDWKSSIGQLFDNRIVGIISFVWAVLATFGWMYLLISGSGGGSRIAKRMSEERPASIVISMNVTDAEILIDGELFKADDAIFKLDSIGVGERRFVIRRENYRSYETAVVFGKGEFKRIDAKLELLPVEIPKGSDTSYISLKSNPDMVRVETSYGKFLGFTPIDSLAFPGGKYTLVFSKNSYATKKRDVALRKNKVTPIVQNLEKLRGMVSLTKMIPDNALLFVGGKRMAKIGRSNMYSVEVGDQVAVIKAEGYDDLTRQLPIRFGDTLSLSDSLRPQYGAVLVQSNPTGAEIFIDESDISVGKAPIYVPRLLANSHRLKAVYRNEKKSQFFKIEKNDTVITKVLFANPNGFLEITTEPAGAEIYLNTARDGDYKSPATRELRPGFYKVRLVHPQFKKFYEATIRVRPDAVSDITYKFEN